MQYTNTGRKCNGQYTGDKKTQQLAQFMEEAEKKLIRNRNSPITPGKSDKTMIPTTEDNPNIITVVDQNGNTDLIKTEMIEVIYINENQN